MNKQVIPKKQEKVKDYSLFLYKAKSKKEEDHPFRLSNNDIDNLKEQANKMGYSLKTYLTGIIKEYAGGKIWLMR